MTDHDINRVLAEKVMGWTIDPRGSYWIRDDHFMLPADLADDDAWNPCVESRHLREVLAKLTAEQAYRVQTLMHTKWREVAPQQKSLWWWTLVCDPRIIATAVAEVVK